MGATKKDKLKTKLKHVKKRLPLPKLGNSLHNVKFLQKILQFLSRHKKLLLIVTSIILLVCIIWLLSQLWLIQTSFSSAATYPKVSVMGIDVGNMDNSKLTSQLTKLKYNFETKKITLVNGKDQWVFELSKLGATIDVSATSQAVWQLNNLSLVDKYRLMTGSISPVVIPKIIFDNKECVKSLSVISIPQADPKDALVYFDQELKLKPDEPGKKFSAVLTCQELSKRLIANLVASGVYFDSIPANIAKADLDPKITQIQALIGKTLSLKNGTYQLDLDPKQLLDLLEISKKDSVIQISWSSAKLDELINSIATNVDTYNSSPALGSCQYLVSSGGNWLDKVATKKIFTDLGADSARLYTLPIAHHEAVIGSRKQVAYGNGGTVYLTFDDGLIYGDRIMNYAACYGVKITFFELGSRVGTDAVGLHRAIAEGHAVQSHGFEHAMYDYGARSYDWQYNDMKQSIDAITSVTGVRPAYFRPPGGNRSATTYDAANANSLKLILWGVSSADSGGISSAATCNNVLAGAFPGASVLMHSTRLTTADAVPCIVEGLAARGYNMQALR